MRQKYIIQLKRKFYWEDVLTFYSRVEALSYLFKLRNEGLQVRLMEVLCVM